MGEDHKHIDQMIRDRFENFEPEPPAHIWDNIRSGINQNPPPPSSTGIILPVIIAISLLIFVSGLIHHFNTEKKNLNYGQAEIHAAGVLSTGSTSLTDAGMQEAFLQTSYEASSLPAGEMIKKTVEPENNIPVRVPFEEKSREKEKAGKAGREKNREKNKEQTNTVQSRSGEWKPGLVQALRAGELSYADAQLYKLSAREIRKLSGYSENYNKRYIHNWTLGLYFNPESTHYNNESLSNGLAYNVSILPGINFSRFFIQSGVNMRFTSDKGNMAVDYNRFLGTYEDVYEVTFDTIDNVVVPTYHTQTVDVYDTLNHYSVSDTRARYTYLEIPVFVGYRHTFGKFSLFAKAGPSASFLLVSDVPAASIPEENARIINVNYQVPLRTSVNWQFLMGAGFDYKLSEKIDISLEPTWRLGLNKEYELQGGKTGNSSAFGIRAGLNYRF
jgi:hypothetical protein